MNYFLNAGVALAAFCSWLGTAVAAPDDSATETRTIDARVTRVKIDGVINVRLKQGDVPMLVLNGDSRLLSKTTSVQSGDTLRIGTEGQGFHFGPRPGVRAELTLPQLREVTSNSLGSSEISGFSGDHLNLVLDGAGSMRVSCNYKTISANLGGMGSMNIQCGAADGIDLNLSGAGKITLGGRSKWLKASLGGLGGLDAQQCLAESVELELSGLGNATVSARQNANLSLSGMGSVTVYGKPLNRSVSVDGLGKVSWK